MKKIYVVAALLSFVCGVAYGLSNSKYNPISNAEIDGTKLQRNFIGVGGTATKNTTTNFDICFADDMIHLGTELLVKNGNAGDYVDVKVVDVNGVIYPAGTVLTTSVQTWYVLDGLAKGDSPYPKKVPAGICMRMIYHSTGILVDPTVAMNLYMHKILE